MADASWDIDSIMDFHPCDTPHGMKDYVLKDLTEEQQSLLNLRKREEIRSNQEYLAEHPEIRGIIVMILRILMRTRPKCDLKQTIGRFFTQPSVDLKEEVYAYLKEREGILSRNSFISVDKTSEEASYHSDSAKSLSQESSHFTKEESDISTTNTQDIITQLFEDRPVEIFEFSEKDVCREVLNEIIEDVLLYIEETDPSLGSIGFPVDYTDATVKSSESLDSDDDENEDEDDD